MKKVASVLCSVVLALLGVTGVANAVGQVRPAAAPNCQYQSSYGTVVSAGYVKRYDGGATLGAIQLCKDSASNYWAFVIFYDPTPSGNWGYAYLGRNRDGKPVDTFGCGSPGGNGYVARGQTRCWTPKIAAPSSSVTFIARGIQCEGTYPTCSFQQAEGYTAKTR